MQVLLLLLGALGWTLDLLLLLLDLNYIVVSVLLSWLFWTVRVVFSLPGTLTLGLVHCWEGVLLHLSMMGELFRSLVMWAAHTVTDAARGAFAGLDGLQLIWNLMCHVVIRSKEIMQRGLLNIAVSGQNLHRQVWEAASITSSLAAYLVNSLVNVCLISVQHVLSSAWALWLFIANVLCTGKDLITALFSELSNTAVAVVILFWTPVQILVDVFVFCSTGVGMILFRYLYEVLLLMLLIWVSRMVFRPYPAFLLLQEKLLRLCRVVLVFVHPLLNSELWRRAAARCVQLIRSHRAAWDRDWTLRRTVAQNAPLRAARAQNSTRPYQAPNPTMGRTPTPSVRLPPVLNPEPDRVHIPQQAPSGSQSRATSSAPESEDPWKLLKQQEESKKCVICQDENKTVLLLPCRHLCLCADCTHILLQQPILQRNCPLCRKMILQTLTVYM